MKNGTLVEKKIIYALFIFLIIFSAIGFYKFYKKNNLNKIFKKTYKYLLWIIIGAIFFGAVHDFTSLIASVRHKGKSIGEVIEAQIGYKGKQLFLIFAWSTLVLVVAAFTILVVKTFVQTPAVGTSSTLFIILAIIFGLLIYRKNAPLGIATVIGVVFLLVCVYLGVKFPLVFSEDVGTAAYRHHGIPRRRLQDR